MQLAVRTKLFEYENISSDFFHSKISRITVQTYTHALCVYLNTTHTLGTIAYTATNYAMVVMQQFYLLVLRRNGLVMADRSNRQQELQIKRKKSQHIEQNIR